MSNRNYTSGTTGVAVDSVTGKWFSLALLQERHPINNNDCGIEAPRIPSWDSYQNSPLQAAEDLLRKHRIREGTSNWCRNVLKMRPGFSSEGEEFWLESSLSAASLGVLHASSFQQQPFRCRGRERKFFTKLYNRHSRGVAQPGSAPALGAR
jgi:hypothetical protein